MTAALATWLIEGLVAVCAAAVLARVFRFNASTRYLTGWIALVAVAAFTWTFSPPPVDTCSTPAAGCGGSATPSEPLVYVASASGLWLSAFIGVWLSVALMRLIRLMPSLHAVYALRDRCREFPPAIEAQLRMWSDVRNQSLSRHRAARRQAALVLCDEIPGATVLGFQRPCIAVPPHLVAALTAAELDQVILHEYAHVQRRDDWTRLAQALVQAVLWVHPAAAVVGRALDRDREMACDEWVVGRTGRPKAYARCLARAAEAVAHARARGANGMRRGASRELTPDELTPALFGRAHDVVRRVDHLLGMRAESRHTVSALSAMAVAIAVGSAVAGVRGANLVGEIGEITAPLIATSASSVLRPLAVRADAGPVEVPPAARRIPVHAAREAASPESRDTAAAAPPILIADLTREPAEAVQLLDARPIAGQYASETAGSLPVRPGTWTRVGTTATHIGVSAGKAGVNLGTMFSRAGTSLARRF